MCVWKRVVFPVATFSFLLINFYLKKGLTNYEIGIFHDAVCCMIPSGFSQQIINFFQRLFLK